MADFHFQRETNRFFSLGMDLNRPADSLKELKYKLLKNVRSYQTGRLEPRQGLTLIGTVPSAVHSIRRLNTPRTSNWTRIIGNGGAIHTGQTSFTATDSGYSGDPLALAPYRPSQSPDPWMYCMDSQRQRKISVLSEVHQVGMPPPTYPPEVGRTAVYHKDIFPPVMSLTGWNNGPPFVCTFPEANVKVNTTISEILYDTGSTGWCLIQPGISTGIGKGILLNVGTESVVVQSATTGDSAPATIASTSLLADGSASSIVLSSITNNIDADSLLENTTRGEVCRVISVIDGPTKVQAIICNPPSLWAVGDTVIARAAFRCYTAATQSTGAAITNTALSVGVNVTKDLALPFTGWMNSPKFFPALDLSQITPTIASTPDSYISVDIFLERPGDVESGRIMFGCTDTADHDEAFENNYFYKTFTPADLATVGNSYRFKLASLVPVGTPSLKSIYYVQMELTVRGPKLVDEFPGSRITFGSLYLAGTPGPDVGTVGTNYIYRYRARCSTTGVVSNWSPATLETFPLSGESVNLTAPSQYLAAPEADFLDFQRRGGSIPDNWYYVGSVANTGSPSTFVDEYSDDVIIANPTEDQIHYQLWPIIGASVAGTVTSASGIVVTGTNFSTTWAPQTPIMINGAWYTIYQVYSSTSLQLFESAGNQSGVTWEVAEPIIQSQPFPCFWGPLSDTFFGCGDPVNPQRLYWTNPGDPDSTTLTKWIDITTPSEPLMNGVIYNGRSYVWSSERFFQIIGESQDETGQIVSWTYVEIPSGKGLWARWAFTNPQSVPGPVLFFLSKDGIYGTDGGTPVDITSEDMRPLFPNEGNLGQVVNTVPYPLMIPGASKQFRLAYYDDYLYFEYAGNASIIPLTIGLSDSLNNWADALGNSSLQAGFIDHLNGWSDDIGVTIPTLPHNFTDGLNNWSDSLGVTLTV